VEQLTRRAYESSDAPALSELLNRIDRHAGGHPGWTPDEVASFADAMVRNATVDTRLAFAPGGVLIAAALVLAPPDGGFRVDLIGGVHPGWRGRGLGRELLGWQLDRATEVHRETASHVTWEIHAGSMAADEDAQRLFRRFDLAPARYWFDMVAPTTGVPTLALPDGLQVVTYSPTFERALHAVHSEAFADHWGYQSRELAEWAKVSVGMDTFRSELSVLALDGEEIAGYVLSYDDADAERLYIGQVGVRRSWRRRGLAGALLIRVLRAAGASGLPRAGLSADADSPTGAVGVYERAGFAVEARAVTYSVPLPAIASETVVMRDHVRSGAGSAPDRT
jgi:mycothiol synthase